MNRIGTLRLLAMVAVFPLLVACSEGEEPRESSAEPEPPSQDEAEQEADMATDHSGSSSELERVVAAARFDLAGRLDMETDRIEVAEARPVTWPNGALGCPQEDGIYTQALVEGFYVKLVADGQDYPYHAGRDGRPFYCEPERSQPPAEDDSRPAS